MQILKMLMILIKLEHEKKETGLLDPYDELYYGPKKSSQSFFSRLTKPVDPINPLDFYDFNKIGTRKKEVTLLDPSELNYEPKNGIKPKTIDYINPEDVMKYIKSQSDQANAPIPQSDQASEPILQSDQASAPIPQSDQASAPIPQSDQASEPIPQSDEASGPIPQSDQASVPTFQNITPEQIRASFNERNNITGSIDSMTPDQENASVFQNNQASTPALH